MINYNKGVYYKMYSEKCIKNHMSILMVFHFLFYQLIRSQIDLSIKLIRFSEAQLASYR